MNKVNLIKQFKFSNDLVNIINEFTIYLDSYFKIEDNINNNYELYEYYGIFKEKIINSSRKYGIIKK